MPIAGPKPAADAWATHLVTAPASVPPGTRVYAIGDVHGCLKRLVALHYAIAADLAANPIARSVLIHLGDVVDRGPDTAGVLWLLSGPIAPKVRLRVDLCGNHEALMMAALKPEATAADASLWLDNGGTRALASYGINPAMPPDAWRAAIPALHQSYLSSLAQSHAEGGYFFVHAGIRPGRPISAQTRDDMLWIRDEFLYDRTRHPLVEVHGHSMVRAPEILANRIGIDTGAVMDGVLSCLVLEGACLRFLTA